LLTRQVIDDPFCDDCGGIDTWGHYFVSCDYVNGLWDQLFTRINQKLPTRHKVTVSETNVLFGILNRKTIVNFIILAGKQFIVYQKFNDAGFDCDAFVSYLQKIFKMEKCTALHAQKIEQFKERWTPFISENLMLTM